MPKDLEARLRKLEQVQTTEGDDQAWSDGILHALSVAYGDGEPFESVPAKVLRAWIKEALDQAYGIEPEAKDQITKFRTNKRGKK